MKMKPKESKFTLRKVFISGLLVIIPIAATVFVFVFLFNLLDGWLAPMGGEVLRTLGFKIPTEYKHIPGFGIVATLILVFFTGLVASNYLGRQLLRFGDRVIKNLPIVRNIYSTIRQVVNSFSVSGSSAFQTVVMFEYPRKGIWALGFLTTPSMPKACNLTKEELVNVFLPTTPNPTSGFFLMMPLKDIKVLDITPEEGLKIIASMGLIQKDEDVPETKKKPISRAQKKTNAKGDLKKKVFPKKSRKKG